MLAISTPETVTRGRDDVEAADEETEEEEEEEDETEEELLVVVDEEEINAAWAAMDKPLSHSRVHESTSKIPVASFPAIPASISRRTSSQPPPLPSRPATLCLGVCLAKETARAAMSEGVRATSCGRVRLGWSSRAAATRAGYTHTR